MFEQRIKLLKEQIDTCLREIEIKETECVSYQDEQVKLQEILDRQTGELRVMPELRGMIDQYKNLLASRKGEIQALELKLKEYSHKSQRLEEYHQRIANYLQETQILLDALEGEERDLFVQEVNKALAPSRAEVLEEQKPSFDFVFPEKEENMPLSKYLEETSSLDLPATFNEINAAPQELLLRIGQILNYPTLTKPAIVSELIRKTTSKKDFYDLIEIAKNYVNEE